MRSMLPMLLIGACFGHLAITAPAQAQSSDSNVSLAAPGFLIKKPKPGAPDVKAQPQAWPRLDPGAVLCRTEADLDRLGARRRGEPVEGSVDCQIVRAPMAITIVQRSGPGRTEVAPSDSRAASGWTDAWLPEKGNAAPASATR